MNKSLLGVLFIYRRMFLFCKIASLLYFIVLQYVRLVNYLAPLRLTRNLKQNLLRNIYMYMRNLLKSTLFKLSLIFKYINKFVRYYYALHKTLTFILKRNRSSDLY